MTELPSLCAEDADIDGVKVVLNSKTERVEVCNALETLLVDAKIAGIFCR